MIMFELKIRHIIKLNDYLHERATKFFILIFFLVGQSVFAGTFAVGERDYVFQDTARHRKIKTFVWYPIDANTKMRASAERSPLRSYCRGNECSTANYF